MTKRFSLLKRFFSSILVLMGKLHQTHGIPVLLYHSLDHNESVISIAPNEFRAHMAFLKDNGYQAISLPKFLDYLYRGIKTPQRKVVLTFDDGFRNNYTEAFPILRDYGFTATIFLVTNHIGSLCSWDKDESIPDLPMLSWEEIRKMSDYGIDFGTHTCSHPYLAQLSEYEIKSELTKSKLTIETRLNKPVEFFCHPYGDTNHKTQRAAEACGYMGAFGGVDFSLANSRDNLYDLKRIGTAHFSSLQDFKAGLLGTYDWYIKLKGFFLKK